MALVRILVDGYSLLHSCPEIAPGRPRHSAAARDELVHWLARYQDATGTPITVFFDGAGAPSGTPRESSSTNVEILYSDAGQTADQLIERVAHRLREFGDVLVVTDDYAERDTITSMGGTATSCEIFMRTLETSLEDLQHDVKEHNRRELRRFRKVPSA